MSFLERALRYQRIHGTRKLISDGWARLRKRLRPTLAALPASVGGSDEHHGWVSARELVAKHQQACSGLRLFRIPAATPPRISLVTDSISKGSLYGGVGTSIIMAALLAESRGARLRIVTRTERAQPSAVAGVLGLYGIELTREVEFAFAPFYDSGYEIDSFPDELYITTSWWTTAATMASVPSKDIVYLLQEDERMFYPYGDEHLRCSQVLANADIRCIINTHLLYDHLVGSGLANLAGRAIAFEPSFPPSVYSPAASRAEGRRTLTFYARPNNVRNLYHFGLAVLETAISRGVIDLAEWDIVFMGKDIPKLRLDDGRYTPRRLENMSWNEYAELCGRTDLALCLMYTPHPSYPPFDMAASGAVVVTNRFGNKQDLGGYSANILCAEPELEAMVAEIGRGVALARDTARRQANHQANRLGRDWKQSFAEVLQRHGQPG